MFNLNGTIRWTGTAVVLAGSVVIAGHQPVAAAHIAVPHVGAATDTTLAGSAETVRIDWNDAPVVTERELVTMELLDRLAARGAGGISGALRASVMLPAEYELAAASFPYASAGTLLADNPAAGRLPDASVNTLVDPRDGSLHSLITLVPFEAKAGRATLDGYRMGFWPAERGSGAAGGELPDGFIRVTEANQHTRLSANFTLSDFLTKDQRDVWPKYVVVSMDLVDKLELMLVELREMGYDARRLHVMSGFRTPQYNAGGEGRASNSRHQYGDAADIFVDNGNTGRMDDLNGDGRVNLADARIIVQAAERVEQKYPSLVGGIGAYAANSAHPPFVHVDTRGTPARWGAR